MMKLKAAIWTALAVAGTALLVRADVVISIPNLKKIFVQQLALIKPGFSCSPNPSVAISREDGCIYLCSGTWGDPVCPGTATGVTCQTEPPGANCTAGGVLCTADTGPFYICHGVDGAAGDPGADGTSVECIAEPPGANCSTGGAKCTSAAGISYVCHGVEGPQGPAGNTGPAGAPGEDGLDGLHCWDLDADATCDAEEDINQDQLCNTLDCKGPTGDAGDPGADGTSVVCEIEAPDTNCPTGGWRCTSASGVHYVCNGAAGPAGSPGPAGDNGLDGTSVSCTVESPGVNCPAGGFACTSASGLHYICHGEQGPPGSPGDPGADGTSVTCILEAPDTNCTYGGFRCDSASGTHYICNGAPGSQGPPGDPGPAGDPGADGTSVTCITENPGANCAAGGWLCTSASGQHYVCHGEDGTAQVSGTPNTLAMFDAAGTGLADALLSQGIDPNQNNDPAFFLNAHISPSAKWAWNIGNAVHPLFRIFAYSSFVDYPLGSIYTVDSGLDGTNETCIAESTDRLFGDRDCDGTKAEGEEWLDNASGIDGSGTGGVLPIWTGTGPTTTLGDSDVSTDGTNLSWTGHSLSTTERDFQGQNIPYVFDTAHEWQEGDGLFFIRNAGQNEIKITVGGGIAFANDAKISPTEGGGLSISQPLTPFVDLGPTLGDSEAMRYGSVWSPILGAGKNQAGQCSTLSFQTQNWSDDPQVPTVPVTRASISCGPFENGPAAFTLNTSNLVMNGNTISGVGLMLPNADNSINLGSSGARWARVWTPIVNSAGSALALRTFDNNSTSVDRLSFNAGQSIMNATATWGVTTIYPRADLGTILGDFPSRFGAMFTRSLYIGNVQFDSDADGTGNPCLTESEADSRIYHDTNCDGTKDIGEQWIDNAAGVGAEPSGEPGSLAQFDGDGTGLEDAPIDCGGPSCMVAVAFSAVGGGSIAATTATSLDADGTNCAAGEAAGGVDASGNAQDCFTPPAGTVTSVATGNGLTGGTITGSGTISGVDAVADGTTKGVATYNAPDFDSDGSGRISIDYTNGQAASVSTKGFLTSTDWSTFNSKGSGTVTSVATANGITGGTITGTGTVSGVDAVADGTTKGVSTFKASDFDSDGTGRISIDYANGQAATDSLKGFLTSADWSTFNAKEPALSKGDLTANAPLSLNATRQVIGGAAAMSIADAVADGTNKGAATFKASDFDSDGTGRISIDYANGQAATGSVKGFLTSTDWTTFNNKQATVGDGRSLTFTGATLNIDAELFTDIKSFTLLSPATGDTNKIQFQLPLAVTITRVSCSTDTGTVTINFDKRAESTPNTAGTNVLSAGLVCDNNSQTSCSSGCDVNTISAGGVTTRQLVNTQITATASSPTLLRVHVEYTIDD